MTLRISRITAAGNGHPLHRNGPLLERDAARFKSIITVYEGMEPKEAAKVLDRLEMSLLYDIAPTCGGPSTRTSDGPPRARRVRWFQGNHRDDGAASDGHGNQGRFLIHHEFRISIDTKTAEKMTRPKMAT